MFSTFWCRTIVISDVLTVMRPPFRAMVASGRNRPFTEDMVDKAYEAISKIRVDERTTNKSIQSLYGGGTNYGRKQKIVEYIVKQGKQRGYVFQCRY